MGRMVESCSYCIRFGIVSLGGPVRQLKESGVEQDGDGGDGGDEDDHAD